MRLVRAACVCAVAVLLPALLTTGAGAFAHRSPDGRCRVSLTAPRPWQITVGEQVTMTGQLVCRHPRNVSGEPVRLFQRIPGTPGFGLVQSTTTNAQGEFEFQLSGVETNRIYHVRSRGAESVDRDLKVAAKVTLAGPPEGTQLLTGAANSVSFSGSVTPADEGARVILQRENASGSDEWHAIGFGTAQANGAFTIAHRFLVPGDASIRVLVRSDHRNVPSPSNVLDYIISQAQNPALTIAAAPDPISYGQSVTITGKLENGKDQPVTLYAHTVGNHTQRGYSPVAQTTTNETGEYAFPAQSPVNSTYYRVKGSGEVSAVLFEGVKYTLSAEVSATAVKEGEAVTFSGAVAPAPSQPNHVVFIERQPSGGGEFHVVHVGYLNAEARFSIPYQPYATGSLVFRVRVAGGPANGSVFSQPFTINVTPVPAALLAPEAPGNTSLPTSGSEGHEKSGDSERREAAETGAEGSEGLGAGGKGTAGGETTAGAEGPAGGVPHGHPGRHHGH
ncbi:MAG TPA: hypothetical protein VMS02_02670 [Solirubrobacteraceae bacterium]|nr:hypothetical protein [Solirubrobacteraceae bacterium]